MIFQTYDLWVVAKESKVMKSLKVDWFTTGKRLPARR